MMHMGGGKGREKGVGVDEEGEACPDLDFTYCSIPFPLFSMSMKKE